MNKNFEEVVEKKPENRFKKENAEKVVETKREFVKSFEDKNEFEIKKNFEEKAEKVVKLPKKKGVVISVDKLSIIVKDEHGNGVLLMGKYNYKIGDKIEF